MHADWQRDLPHDVFDRTGLLRDRFAECDLQIGTQDRENYARYAAAGAYVEHALGGIEELLEPLSIHDVARDEFLEGCVASEVELFIPLPKGARIAVEQCRLFVGEIDSMNRPSATASVSLS